MRGIVQRVAKASVSVDGEVISSIGRGICVLVGLSREEDDKDIDFMVRKLMNLRIFDDDSGKRWNKSVADLQLEILCFTLHSVLKGNKPDFHKSMGPEQAPVFYNKFMEKLRAAYKSELVKDGKFGAYMQVEIQNDGPVTIILDSQKDTGPSSSKESAS